MPALPPLNIDLLWQLQRVGGLALSPDGTRAVCSATRYSMDDNKGRTQLWLLPTDRAEPRALTACGDGDGQPAWSPDGHQVGFLAKREQHGKKDTTRQFYLIDADGGEARRISDFAPGIEVFRWLPGGRRIAFVAWVWPELKGAKAQARRHKAFSERKESGYATSEAQYRHWDSNLPMGRVLHLHLLDLDSGRITDLFEGTELEMPRDEAMVDDFVVSPDERRIAFVFDPAPRKVSDNLLALGEIDLRSRRVRTLRQDKGWAFSAPAYSPDGARIAFIAANLGKRHTSLPRLAMMPSDGRRWQVLSEAWDHIVDAPLRWAPDGASLLFTAQQRGRSHLWRHTLASGDVETVVDGGWVSGFGIAATPAGELIVSAADSAMHPTRFHAHREGAPALRLETFNDKELARCRLGEVREVTLKGGRGDPVQMWLCFPPDFDPKTKHPALQDIHGGPYAAAGDTWSWRWNPHVLASRGHVVAMVNFHGSTGFGFDFMDSIVGHQGELEMQDIEAGTDWLCRQPWIDTKRLHATGGSYGGFMVAWMNGHLPAGRYASMVCHAGVFDRVATFAADSWAHRPKDLQAQYWVDMPKVLSQSPMNFAAQMQTPTLVIHGALDYRVPDCNGLAYYNTLKARGIDARLLWFPDENHWILKPRNSRQWTTEFLDWLQAHEKPGRAGPTRAKNR
jgi:dipeptidyl aminopeptidase/acylaminoacyl peptidase